MAAIASGPTSRFAPDFPLQNSKKGQGEGTQNGARSSPSRPDGLRERSPGRFSRRWPGASLRACREGLSSIKEWKGAADVERG